jgi:hypothetical protein
MNQELIDTDTQFLARMILATREGHQISSFDAQRLGNLADFGPGPTTTMPEERRDASKLPASASRVERASGRVA